MTQLFKENFFDIREKLLNTPQYIQFNIINTELNFITNQYLGTQFGRELVYELIKKEDKKYEEIFYQLNLILSF